MADDASTAAHAAAAARAADGGWVRGQTASNACETFSCFAAHILLRVVLLAIVQLNVFA